MDPESAFLTSSQGDTYVHGSLRTTGTWLQWKVLLLCSVEDFAIGN